MAIATYPFLLVAPQQLQTEIVIIKTEMTITWTKYLRHSVIPGRGNKFSVLVKLKHDTAKKERAVTNVAAQSITEVKTVHFIFVCFG
jgi:hypothetical protein